MTKSVLRNRIENNCLLRNNTWDVLLWENIYSENAKVHYFSLY